LRNLSYTDYIKLKFPLFKLGAYKGGIIVEQKQLGSIQSVRLLNVLWYEEKLLQVLMTVRVEWAYRKYLNGKDGKVQKNSKGQWKPIRDVNECRSARQCISTIDVYRYHIML
jgi:cell division protein FtsI (penicillin-binding protein 3)